MPSCNASDSVTADWDQGATYDNEDPPPAFVSTDSIHMDQAVGEEASEGASNDTGGEEETEAPLQLISLVVH